jgi:uncharacterized protein involved in exopolysaccharide biosynthesis
MGLDELLRGLWRWRWRLALAAMLAYAALATIVWSWPRSYVATLIVAPAETTGIATSALLTPAPFLQPSLLDQRPGGNFAVYLAALRTPEVAAVLARDTPILAALTERRTAPPLGALREALGLRVQADLDDVVAFLERRLAATPSLASVTWTVEVVHRDRVLALAVLERAHHAAEARVRETLSELAARRIAALEARLRVEPDLFLRQTLHELLAQQQRAALVVSADEAAAARLVSHPAAELRPSVPNRPLLLALLMVATGLAVGLIGAALLLLRGFAAPALPPPLPVWPVPAPLSRREPALTRTRSGDGAC